MRAITSIIFILVIFLTSCYKDVKVPDIELIQQPVINCLFQEDSTWSVEVSLTGNSNQTTNPHPAGTRVIIRGSDGFMEELAAIDGLRFVSGTGQRPRAGVLYTMQATVPGFKTVSATSTIPNDAVFEVLNFDTTIQRIVPYPLSDAIPTQRATIAVSDTDQDEKYFLLRPLYYLLEDLTIYKVTSTTIDTLRAKSRITAEDSASMMTIVDKEFYGIKQFDEEVGSLLRSPATLVVFYKDAAIGYFGTYDPEGFKNQRSFVTDLYFKHLSEDYRSVFGLKPAGSSLDRYIIDMLYSYYPGDVYTIQNGVLVVKGARWFLDASVLSKEAYDYLTTYLQNIANRSNPFAEFINVYTNVENGVGIFAGISSNRIRVY